MGPGNSINTSDHLFCFIRTFTFMCNFDIFMKLITLYTTGSIHSQNQKNLKDAIKHTIS